MRKIIQVQVKTGSKKTELVFVGEVLHARLAAQPVDGLANKELIHALSKFLKVSSAYIKIKCGKSSKNKLVEIIYS